MIEFLLCVIIAGQILIWTQSDVGQNLGVAGFLPFAFGIGLLLFGVLTFLVWAWEYIKAAI